MKTKITFLTGALVAVAIMMAIPAQAYQFYSDDSGAVGDGTQNCAACHGEFRSGTYMPPSGDLAWDSHLHAGHPGAASGAGHFRATIVSERFEGLSRVAAQRLVYQALDDEMGEHIHALAMRTLTPSEDGS